jgi:hypothetical protein
VRSWKPCEHKRFDLPKIRSINPQRKLHGSYSFGPKQSLLYAEQETERPRISDQQRVHLGKPFSDSVRRYSPDLSPRTTNRLRAHRVPER